jgi:hypothetical protein
MHYHKLADAQATTTLIVKLMEQINLTSLTITSSDVKDFCKKMQELKQIFDEVDGHFKEFIQELITTVPSTSSVTL